MKPVRNTISLFADITGIFAFIGLTATGIAAWLEKSHSHAWNIVAFIFIAFVIMPVIGYFALKRLAAYREERKWNRFAPKLQEFTLSSQQLRDKLASDEMLSRMHQKLLERIHNWDPDAITQGMHMIETIDAEKTYLVALSVHVYSSWRKKKGIIEILMDSKGGEDFLSDLKDIRTSKPPAQIKAKTFFEHYPDWRDEVIRLYGPVEFEPKKIIHVHVEQTTSNSLPKVYFGKDPEEPTDNDANGNK